MDVSDLFSLIGYSGTIAIGASYVVALLQIIERRPALFLWLNLYGGVALCFPTYLAETLVTHVLNGFWIIIAISGLADHYSKGRFRLSYRTLIGIASLAGLVVVYLGLPQLFAAESLDVLVIAASMLAMLSFMAGYFYISTAKASQKVIVIYLALSMLGNVLYLPILFRDQNWPVISLQLFCFSAGAIKLAIMCKSQNTTPIPENG